MDQLPCLNRRLPPSRCCCPTCLEFSFWYGSALIWMRSSAFGMNNKTFFGLVFKDKIHLMYLVFPTHEAKLIFGSISNRSSIWNKKYYWLFNISPQKMSLIKVGTRQWGIWCGPPPQGRPKVGSWYHDGKQHQEAWQTFETPLGNHCSALDGSHPLSPHPEVAIERFDSKSK